MPSAQKVYSMVGNENLWQVAMQCHAALDQVKIPHSICGGVAVCLHGYQRNTIDIDLIIQRSDANAVRSTLEGIGLTWDSDEAEFRSPSGIQIQFLYAGDRAGKNSEVSIPEPVGDQNVELVEDLPVLRLSRLIEMKIASAMGNLRRTHKDLADVVELIVVRNLNSSFARHLHKSVRPTFRELVRNAQSAE